MVDKPQGLSGSFECEVDVESQTVFADVMRRLKPARPPDIIVTAEMTIRGRRKRVRWSFREAEPVVTDDGGVVVDGTMRMLSRVSARAEDARARRTRTALRRLDRRAERRRRRAKARCPRFPGTNILMPRTPDEFAALGLPRPQRIFASGPVAFVGQANAYPAPGYFNPATGEIVRIPERP